VSLVAVFRAPLKLSTTTDQYEKNYLTPNLFDQAASDLSDHKQDIEFFERAETAKK
jgi:hypothetical protein